jgi:hypothetical protein
MVRRRVLTYELQIWPFCKTSHEASVRRNSICGIPIMQCKGLKRRRCHQRLLEQPQPHPPKFQTTVGTVRHALFRIISSSGLIIILFYMIWPGSDLYVFQSLQMLMIDQQNRFNNNKNNDSISMIGGLIVSSQTEKWTNDTIPIMSKNERMDGLVHMTANSTITYNGNKHNACDDIKSVADIRQCYSSDIVRKLHHENCQSIQTWKDVQFCLMKRYRYKEHESSDTRIREVHIVGERNSGTKFVTQFLQQCFPHTSGIRVHRDFIRSKHFFQPIQPHEDYSESLIVVVVRDPIEWMAAMREFPYHSPNHIAGFHNAQVVPLPWQEFVNKKWTTEFGSRADRKLHVSNRTEVTCHQGFRFDEVKPCLLDDEVFEGPPWNLPYSRVRGFIPVYEQQQGIPYDHLLQMRSDKIVNWILQIPMLMRIGGFLVVRYEDILEQGNEFVLKQVNAILNNQPITSRQSLPEHCSAIAPQPDRIGKRHIAPDFKEWINRNLDVETEHLLGYK